MLILFSLGVLAVTPSEIPFASVAIEIPNYIGIFAFCLFLSAFE